MKKYHGKIINIYFETLSIMQGWLLRSLKRAEDKGDAEEQVAIFREYMRLAREKKSAARVRQ